MNKSWPTIRATLKNGKPMVLVDARISGRGQRRFFSNEKTAAAWAEIQRARRNSEGTRAFDDRELGIYGWTVADAIRFALEHLRKSRTSATIETAMKTLIDAKRAAGRSTRYCYDLVLRLGRLCKTFEGKTVAQISTADLEEFLASLNVAAETRNAFRRDICTLWGFAEKRGWGSAQTARNTERAKGIDRPPEILRPEQAVALLSESKDNDLLAFHAISLFAGLRVSEVKQLDWRDVDLAGGFIHVGAKISKTRSRRLVPILGNLRAWLQPIARTSGTIVGLNLRKRHVAARQRAGIMEWQENCMRHTFVSCRLAVTANAAQVALESGHDQAILFRHYRELVKPRDAQRFFEIHPAGEPSDKVVAIS
jgi:integrase